MKQVLQSSEKEYVTSEKLHELWQNDNFLAPHLVAEPGPIVQCFYCGTVNSSVNKILHCSNCNGSLSDGYRFCGIINKVSFYLKE